MSRYSRRHNCYIERYASTSALLTLPWLIGVRIKGSRRSLRLTFIYKRSRRRREFVTRSIIGKLWFLTHIFFTSAILFQLVSFEILYGATNHIFFYLHGLYYTNADEDTIYGLDYLIMLPLSHRRCSIVWQNVKESIITQNN